MGRVRRYKKYKAADPFSKQKKTVTDTVHDEPPDVFDERVKKRKRSSEESWDEDAVILKEAKRIHRNANLLKVEDHKVEAKGPDETMKDFKIRIRNETRKVLHEELRGMTSTAQKRKERLKERKIKRKSKNKPDVYKEEVMEFHAGQDGRIRPSDLGAPSSFSGPEVIKFGEQASRPPDLSFGLVDKARQKAINKGIDRPGSSNSVSNVSAATAGAKFMERQKMREEREKFLKQMNSAQARSGMSGADAESTYLASFVRNNSNHDKIQKSEKELQQAQKLAREAYAILREKRIKDNEKQRGNVLRR